ncbi:hypothetical protein AB0O47_38865 [Streptomyces noursei]|uniref:hypothetical protein n=1 Tax=Streptomyces noursei TaxID=1971 RepID=UPI00344E5221
MTTRRLAALAALTSAALLLAAAPAVADGSPTPNTAGKKGQKWVCVSFPGNADADVTINAGKLLKIGTDSYTDIFLKNGIYCGWLDK